jgi:hypothetical protein
MCVPIKFRLHESLARLAIIQKALVYLIGWWITALIHNLSPLSEVVSGVEPASGGST